MQAATDIDFLLQAGNGTRVLSHGQLTHLQAIIQELISNSIKHADCNKIMLRIAAPEQRLTVSYSDDGKGIGPGVGRGIGPGVGSSSGIGIKNMEERVALLRGSFQLNDAWPNGYSIEISIPLV